jgi:hypothetical protein
MPMPPEMFTVLGEIVVLWSRIETSLDNDIGIMMQGPIVCEGVKEHPRAFGKKLSLWRRSVRRLYPKIDYYQDQANEFERVARIVARYRNHVIHGSWSLQPKEDGAFTVTRYEHRVGGTIDGINKLEVDLGFLKALLDDMRKLDNQIMSLVVTKLMHAHLGLLKAERRPSPQHPNLPSSPKRAKRRRPLRSSPRCSHSRLFD